MHFREESRSFYDLDGMWADAPDIPLDLDEAAEPDPRTVEA